MATGIGLLVLLLVLLAFRQHVVVILMAAAAYVHYFWGKGQISFLIEDIWIAFDSELLLAIPMFIIAGAVMTRGSIAARLIEVIRSLAEWMPGGLGLAAVLSCAIFSAISGSSVVTMLAIGSIMYPALRESGYQKHFALGSIASAGTLGIIIPPSIPLILYGIATEVSIVDLFFAGILPGVFLTLLFSVWSLWTNRSMKAVPFSVPRLAVALRRGIWSMLLPVIMLGGIYSGYFSPTEAAAAALGYGLLVELFIHREMKIGEYYGIVLSTSRMLGSLMPIVAVALSLKVLLAIDGIPQAFANWMQSMVASKFAFLVAVNLILLIVGCLIDTVSAILLLAPILIFAAKAYGIDPVHFGIIMVVNLEIGLLTPPVGLNVIVAMTAFKEKFSTVLYGILPFFLLMLTGLGVITAVPWLSLALLGK